MSILYQVTYSIYLVHLIVIPAVMKLIPHPLAVFPTPGERPVLAVVVAVSRAVHLVVERPFFFFKRVLRAPCRASSS